MKLPYASFRLFRRRTLTLDGVGSERGMGGYGGTVGIPLSFDTRPDEVRGSRLGQHDLRVGTMFLDVLTRSVEGASGPCLLFISKQRKRNQRGRTSMDVRTQYRIFEQSWRMRARERTEGARGVPFFLLSLTVPGDPIIEIDPGGVQVVDDLGPLFGRFRVGHSTAQRSRGGRACAGGHRSFRTIHITCFHRTTRNNQKGTWMMS